MSVPSSAEIIDYAISTDRIVISHDTDFGTLLAYRGAACIDLVGEG